MNERSRNIAVGITTIVGLVGLAAMMLLFGYVPEWLEPGYRVQVNLPYAAGLSAGSRARLSGIDVGEIEAVMLREPVGSGVVAVVKVRSDMQLPKMVAAKVEAPLLGGSPIIEFYLEHPDGVEHGWLAQDGSAVVDGEVPSITGSLARELKSALEGPETQFQQLADDFNALSSEWQAVGKNLNQLLEPRSIDQVQQGEAEANINTVITRLDARLAEIEQVLKGVNEYVNDDKLRENIRITAANARELSESLEARFDALQKRYVAVADDLSGMISKADKIIENAREGNGTLGKLVNDPALYNNLTDAVQRMKMTVDQMRLLIEKWKAEGVPVQL